jgi:hypothetical protein
MVSKITSPITPLEEVNKINEIIDDKQDTLVSGTNIKTVNGSSLLGSGDITIGGSVDIDNKSITENSSNQLQTVGVINSRDSSTAVKTWTGTRSQYDAIATKDANTLYNITDDTDVSLTILEALYPVGSIYITTANTCPLSTLISGSTWTLVSTGIVKAGEVPVKGTEMALGLTDGNYNGAISLTSNPYLTDNSQYGTSIGSSASGHPLTRGATLGVTTDSSKSGMVLDTTSFTLSVNIFERTA